MWSCSAKAGLQQQGAAVNSLDTYAEPVQLAEDTDYVTVDGNGGTAGDSGADAGLYVLLDDQDDAVAPASPHSQLYDVPFETTTSHAVSTATEGIATLNRVIARQSLGVGNTADYLTLEVVTQTGVYKELPRPVVYDVIENPPITVELPYEVEVDSDAGGDADAQQPPRTIHIDRPYEVAVETES